MNIVIDLNVDITPPVVPSGWKIERFLFFSHMFNEVKSSTLFSLGDRIAGKMYEDFRLTVQAEHPDNSVNEATWDEESKSWHWYKPWTDYEAA